MKDDAPKTQAEAQDKKSDGPPKPPIRAQLHIQDASSAEDRAQVEQLLVAIASESGIADTTVVSSVPDTIRCYSERIGYGFAIGARVSRDLIIVDFNEGKAPTPCFFTLKARLTNELSRMFGKRLIFPTESQHIAIPSGLPLSDAAREFIRNHYKIAQPKSDAAI